MRSTPPARVGRMGPGAGRELTAPAARRAPCPVDAIGVDRRLLLRLLEQRVLGARLLAGIVRLLVLLGLVRVALEQHEGRDHQRRRRPELQRLQRLPPADEVLEEGDAQDDDYHAHHLALEVGQRLHAERDGDVERRDEQRVEPDADDVEHHRLEHHAHDLEELHGELRGGELAAHDPLPRVVHAGGRLDGAQQEQRDGDQHDARDGQQHDEPRPPHRLAEARHGRRGRAQASRVARAGARVRTVGGASSERPGRGGGGHEPGPGQ